MRSIMDQSTSTDISARLEGLTAAADAAAGRVDDALVSQAHDVVERAGSRLKLSSEHTVVGIAGATGSGKSSTFNALTGLELSAVGVRRPTTSWATACVWGSQGATELLEWLGIPDRHQTTRDSMLDTRREGRELDGVVLLDLPDHDSTEVSHHLEVDRLVVLADMLIWVVDPQKYADAAIHDRYLEPFKTHSEVMVVVLNHIDEVPEERREAMVADLKRLLVNDGLPDVPVLAVSARLGWGIPELKALIAERVKDKQMTKGRLEADVRAAGGRIAEVTGEASPKPLAGTRVQALDAAVADAAGVPTIVEAVERSTTARAARAVGWPLVSWVSLLRPDPIKRLPAELSSVAGQLRAAGSPAAGSVQGGAVAAEVRKLADEASEGVGAPWRAAIGRVATGRLPELGERISSALSSVDVDARRLPGWVQLVRVVQWLLVIGAVAGAVWAIARAGKLGSVTKVAGLPAPIALLVVCLVVGIVLGVVARIFVGRAARAKAAQVAAQLHGAVSTVDHELVVTPVETELAAYTKVREGLGKALA
jgi:GTPase Era involved in 16S rRNA processing